MGSDAEDSDTQLPIQYGLRPARQLSMESTNANHQASTGNAAPEELAALLKDLGIEGGGVRTLQDSGPEGSAEVLVARLEKGQEPDSATVAGLCEGVDRALSETGAFFLYLCEERSEDQLAAWRNGLWPLLHASVIYTISAECITRRTLAGSQALESGAHAPGTGPSVSVMFFRRRVHSMGPDATTLKFDQNASGWNGHPGTAGYPHFRWMRKFVACFANLPRDSRILDFGCGAGWCGVEAARQYGASELAFFDPSPEMVKIAETNAREAGIAGAIGRTGFGESPPFPGPGEEPYDAVISSGVISFAPDPEVWIDGLVPTVKKGGILVIGDIQRTSRGMARRRRGKALLPARELNGQTAESVRRALESHGFEWTGGAGYQLTRPFPEAMHVNETKLRGLLTRPLLWSNQLAAATNRAMGLPGENQFDSWVMSLIRRS